MKAFDSAIDALMSANTDGQLMTDIDVATTYLDKKRICTTGMGKAGHIARKFAATLSSMGVPAHYIHPGEAAHGDLGQLQPDDVLVALSTSGKTVEVVAMVEQAQELYDDITVWAITAKKYTPLYSLADGVITIGDYGEACPEDLTPTTSTTLMLVTCDQLALNLANRAGFTADTFAKRHHGGYLGQKARQ